MSTSAFMTELEAVNIILESCEEAPVSSLSLTGLRPLEKARAGLLEASRLVQSGGWKFNTEYSFPLTRTLAGEIPLADNVLRVDVDDRFLSSVDPVQRGPRLYDAAGRSYTFTQDLTGTVVSFLTWDELPQPARHYITIKAARTMQGRTSISESVYRYSQADEDSARLSFTDHESTVGDHNMLRDSLSVSSILRERYDFL